jgi:hypothetical protein
MDGHVNRTVLLTIRVLEFHQQDPRGATYHNKRVAACLRIAFLLPGNVLQAPLKV